MTPAPTTPEGIAAQEARGQAEREAAFVGRHHYRILLRIEGRIRFLSHLEMVDTLLGALRRSGVQLALSEGMRPKPRIKVAMPRPVATEAWSDIVEVELQDGVDADQFALQLSESLPAGLVLQGVEQLEGAYASAASRVAGATWRWSFDPQVSGIDELQGAVRTLLDAQEWTLDRSSPGKRPRTVDIRRFLGDVDAAAVNGEPVVRAFIRLTPEGSAKPEEFIRALGAALGRDVSPRRTVREAIAIAEPGSGRVAEPELIGADVPDGPAKPWGAC